MAIATGRTTRTEIRDASYKRLEEKVLERDQSGASDIFYDLVRAGRPLPELVGEIVRIHAPYTHVPYHQRLDVALMDLRAFEAVNWTAAYLKAGFDRAPLVDTLATAAAKTGNDPHNQELGSCLLEDYAHSTARDRDRLLLACAKHTGGHRKYGDHLEAYRRFAEAFGLASGR